MLCLEKYQHTLCGKNKLKEEHESATTARKEMGEAVNRAPYICHLPGLDRYSTFFPTMTLHFVTIIAIIRREKSILATLHNGPVSIYIQSMLPISTLS